MKLRFLFFASLVTFLSFSQDYSPTMSVSKSDLELTSYAKDSTANALVIYDYGNSFIDQSTFWLRVQIEQKIKILRKEGISRGDFEVQLFKGKSSTEVIKNIEGTTYNLENGNIIKTELKPSAIFEEENDDYILVKFALPNVKVGSVITVSYETQSRFISKYQPWYFQGPDPVLYSEYNTSIPGNYEYNIKLVGGLPLDTEDTRLQRNCINVGNNASADCAISKYIMKNVPAYKPEGFTTTALNYTARIEYELSVVRGFDGSVDKYTKTWRDVDKELESDSDFGRQVSKKSLVKNLLPVTISAITDDLEKAKAIRQFVLDNYKWNGKSERYDVSIKELIKEKSGSAFEINLLLENLLSSEDFKVFPILMSTRENGLATKIYPVLTDFNYVVLKTAIGGKDYYLDATDTYLSFGELPFRCLNQYGRVVDFDNGSYWEDMEVNNFSFRQHRVKINSFEDDTFSGEIMSKYKGYHALNPKEKYDKNKIAYKENKANSLDNIAIENHEIMDFDKTSSEFNEKIEMLIEPEFIGNKIYLNPFVIKFFEENPFKLQQRTYPIDFGYKDIYTYAILINLNEDLQILEAPSSMNYKLSDNSGSFNFHIEKKENQLTLFFKIKFDKAIYGPEIYDELKNFMNKVVDAQINSVIVLEKK